MRLSIDKKSKREIKKIQVVLRLIDYSGEGSDRRRIYDTRSLTVYDNDIDRVLDVIVKALREA